MKVKELIAKLQKVPEDADVAWYGADTEGMPVECVNVLFIRDQNDKSILNSKNERKICKNGYVLLSDYHWVNSYN